MVAVNSQRNYSQADKEYIEQNLHLTDRQLGDNLGRTATAIKEMRRVLGISRRNGDEADSRMKHMTICWTCARAYALPDPYGCGWFREPREQVWDDATLRPTWVPDGVGDRRQVDLYVVRACRQYEPGNKAR